MRQLQQRAAGLSGVCFHQCFFTVQWTLAFGTQLNLLLTLSFLLHIRFTLKFILQSHAIFFLISHGHAIWSAGCAA